MTENVNQEPFEFEEDVVISVDELQGDRESALTKALDVIKQLLGFETVEKEAWKRAVTMAVRILRSHAEKENVPNELVKAVQTLIKLAGLEALKREVPEEAPIEEVEEQALEGPAKALLTALRRVWDELPDAVKNAASKVAAALGYPEAYPEAYPEPRARRRVERQRALERALKSLLRALRRVWDKMPPAVRSAAEKVGRALGYEPLERDVEYELLEQEIKDLEERLKQTEKALEEAEIARRLVELKPLSDKLGIAADVLLKLQDFDEKVFDEITKHVADLKEQMEKSGLFKEIGTELDTEQDLASSLHTQALEMVEKGLAADYSEAISILSAKLSKSELDSLFERR